MLITGVVALDQALKALVIRTLPMGASIVLLPILSLTRMHNPGVAFSLLPQVPAFVPAVIVATLLVLLFRHEAGWAQDPQAQRALALLAGGAVGNLIDRVRFGAVIDYLDLHIWPVFNLADIAVTIGAALLILSLVARTQATAQPRGDR
ncbi:MAG: signal peptidase II [Bacillati bacterium ANGP1]|uniref:Lipoprotein signal peptidase n=1 Tax=Candidatus Segetimicrobium genomatis TaxID=2569760 RepID=A0A537LXI6_9BACT|nr:MAG: signal peptidase II [Terrabacteria group bacterium ANGP1]TMJ12357.1 MAG: signal peptidase II [Terrabacteria group bacterium ANGP1]